MTAKRTIWIGQIPDIFGYGIIVAEDSEEKCIKVLRKAYREMRKTWNGEFTFAKTMEYFGGSVEEIDLGKAYYGQFRS